MKKIFPSLLIILCLVVIMGLEIYSIFFKKTDDKQCQICYSEGKDKVIVQFPQDEGYSKKIYAQMEQLIKNYSGIKEDFKQMSEKLDQFMALQKNKNGVSLKLDENQYNSLINMMNKSVENMKISFPGKIEIQQNQLSSWTSILGDEIFYGYYMYDNKKNEVTSGYKSIKKSDKRQY